MTTVLTKEQLNLRLRRENAIEDLAARGVNVGAHCDLTTKQLQAMAAIAVPSAETLGSP